MTKKVKETKELMASSPIEISYITGFKTEILEAQGKKSVLITGKLMDDSFNKNSWGIVTEDIPIVAQQIAGSPVKVQHSKSDWDIIGTGVQGTTQGTDVIYQNKITDPSAIEKFESGTWNAQNMGISPKIQFDSIICSVCGENARNNHQHIMGHDYEGQTCRYLGKSPHLIEQSLTSEPAYAPQAGSIDSVGFSASMSKFVHNDTDSNIEKDGGKVMSAEMEAIVLEKDNKINGLKAELETHKTKEKELEASAMDFKKKAEEFEAKFNDVSAINKTFIAEKRTAELEKKISDKELVASIVAQNLTDEQFKAELSKIEKIQKSAGAVTTSAATLPAEDSNDTKNLEAKVGRELFGSSYESLIKKEELK